MFPILLKIGPLTLHTYGLLVAVGFLVGYYLARRRFEHKGLPLVFFDQLIFVIMVSGILGARLFFILLETPASLLSDPLSFFRIWEGGLVYFGGFIGAFVGIAIYSYIKELSLLGILDALAVPLLLSHAIGRLGCFAAGCCYGLPTDSILGVVFSDPEALAPLGVRLHPTQLYSALGDFLLFLGLLKLEKKVVTRGVLFASYLMSYGGFRFLIEFIRNDDRGPVWQALWPSQWISIAAIFAGGALLVYVKKTKRT